MPIAHSLKTCKTVVSCCVIKLYYARFTHTPFAVRVAGAYPVQDLQCVSCTTNTRYFYFKIRSHAAIA